MLDTSEEGRIIAAYRAGADAELEAVIAWMEKMRYWGYDKAISDLRAARRPSLKELAFKALAAIEGDFNIVGDRADTIRRALEQLPDDLTYSRTLITMPVTTIKRCQSNRDWWYTVEDCNIEVYEEPGSGLAIKSHDEHYKEGRTVLSVSKEDALLIRDAINQLYPPA